MKSSFMQFNLKITRFLSFAALLWACGRPVQKETPTTGTTTGTGPVKYARRFSIRHEDKYDVLYIFGNRNTRDTTTVFVISKEPLEIKPGIKNAIWIQAPCKKIAALSSIYSAMFCELNSVGRLAAIDNVDYVNNPDVTEGVKTGRIVELARTPQIDLEKTIALKPDIIFTFGMGDWEKDLDEKLRRTGIPVAISIDHLEETPLARAEWIKFFALFVNESHRADSIFSTVEEAYLKLQATAAKAREHPSVFSEIKYSDAWYLPGGKSYVATLFADAGANYLWKNERQAGSLPLSFEQVYASARDADYWLNLSTVRTKKELLSYEPRYSQFKAFQTGQLYNNTKHTNKFGYSDYWETGMIHPERVLSDLIGIFHPSLRQDFYYYEHIQ